MKARRQSKLNTRILIILLVFLMLVLLIFYVFQMFFLDDFYLNNKKQSIISIGDEIAENINDDDINEIADQYSMDNEVCTLIINSETDFTEIASGRNCALRNLSVDAINMIAQDLNENGGSKLIENLNINSFNNLNTNLMIYGKLVDSDVGLTMILVSSMVTPLNTTISTIQSQYIVIAIVLIIAVILLAYILSRFISKPIDEIKREANLLPLGQYNGDSINTSISEVNELNKTLINANNQINIADKTKKELIGNVSHDLKTPLTMIIGYSEMIRDIPEENTEENINIIIDEAKRLTSLVNDLVDYSKISSIELEENEIDLNELLTEVYKQYEKYCKEKDIKFNLKLIDSIKFKGDEKRLKQVLYNFINNSVNYNNSKDKLIELGVEKKDNIYRVYVYDNGNGIKQEDINLIWDRYYKVDKEHKRSEIGSGIGLSLSRDILVKQGFNYGVESEYGKYSKFYFEIKK